MSAYLRTAVELDRDGTRRVYHRKAEPAKEGWAWTHPDTQAERDGCSACTHGTLESARQIARRLQAGGAR